MSRAKAVAGKDALETIQFLFNQEGSTDFSFLCALKIVADASVQHHSGPGNGAHQDPFRPAGLSPNLWWERG